MKTKAAVVYEAGKPIEIEELDLDGPREGEVLIRYTYAGLCHSDVHVAHGDLEARLPMVLGHEGAGIIEEVGPGVTRVKAGRPRRLLVHPQLRHLPLLRHRSPVDLRHGRHHPRGLPARRAVPDHRSARPVRRHVHARHLQPVRRHPPELLRQGRRRPPARQGRPRRLRRAHRAGARPSTPPTSSRATPWSSSGIGGIGINAVQGARLRRREERHRHRPAREQAREGDGARRDPRVRQHRRGHGRRSPTSPAARWPTRPSSPPAS